MYKHETDLEPGAQARPDAHDRGGWSQSAGERQRSRGLSPRASLAVRRSIGLVIALAMAYGIFHVVFRTDVLAPVLAYAEPVKNGVDWVLEDPRRAWMALAALAIPHIGAYYFFFEDRR